MTAHEDFHTAMPTMRSHEGIWEGQYRHIDRDGTLKDIHRTQVRCEFPDSGPYVYIQHNRFTWETGRTAEAVLNGTFFNNRLWWDKPTFKGYAWEHEGVIFLELDRKDEPGSKMRECILMGEKGHRSRTWHWFRDGQLYRRTLVDEYKVG